MKILSNKKITAENLKDFKGEELKIAKRSLRQPLLKAFDVFKTNVSYGIEIQTEEEKGQILEWYGKLLDLNKHALCNVPEKIKRYL